MPEQWLTQRNKWRTPKKLSPQQTQSQPLKLDLPQIREMIRLLSNMTNNLNQIARRLNAQGQMYDTEMEEMLQKQDELWQMMRKLLSILERTG